MGRKVPGRKKRRVIYKPDYAGVHQIAVAKRTVGIVLAVLIAAVVVLAAVWLAPAVWHSMQATPQEQEAEEQALAEKAEEAGDSLVKDEKTGLPLFEDDVNLFTINAEHPADGSYVPELETVCGVEVDRRIVPAVQKLVDDAWEQGYELGLTGGYVSYEAQEALFTAQVESLLKKGSTKIMAHAYAKEKVALPGACDLQTGMCITVKGKEKDFGTTALCGWLENNMAQYGFVFRYPEGKEAYTGEEGSKLVLRYVGPENAAAMRRLSMSLEEYVDYLQ